MNAGELLRVTGLVQGVGFRPFVHRLAARHGLAGWVRNTSADVEIAVEGSATAIDAFARDLRDSAPVQSRVEQVDRHAREPEGRIGFVIESSVLGLGRQPVSPDVAICRACQKELHDPANRRHGYPFITCTDCGPRFSIIEGMPYDRMRTSMRAFPMCALCRAEYLEPGNRRHHSQTNSCAACGPRLWLADPGGEVLARGPAGAIAAAVACLESGGIVALRGLGGFQLAVDATDDDAVRELRHRKRREARPFAVMVATLADARRQVHLSDEAMALLVSPERPIIVAPSAEGPLAPSVAPGLEMTGVMLPTTALHHLLLEGIGRPLVMTSGNLVDEPIAIGNAEALNRLAGVADVFLLHDREIVARFDDSVVRTAGRSAVMIRRSRGYAPMPLTLPVEAPLPLVAVGPHLKNTLTLASGSRAWVSQHIGDLDDVSALDHFHAVLAQLEELFDLRPAVAVRDLHPGYLSTRVAAQLHCRRVIAVQHHHAHIAAVAAEHGVSGPVIGLACDGTGHGDDETVWGSEVMLASLTGYHRLGHLLPAPLPGGDAASRRGWRSALGYLSLLPDGARLSSRAFAGVHGAELEAARAQLRARVNSPMASSLGRLFDAAAAILGVRRHSHYEGQAAMELEALAGRRAARALAPCLRESQGRTQLDPLPLLVELDERTGRGESVADLAAVFHDSVAAGLVEIVRRSCAAHEVRTVVLSGGSFQNLRLLATMRRGLEHGGFTVLSAQQLPPNDGAISFGQAAVAAAILAQEGAS